MPRAPLLACALLLALALPLAASQVPGPQVALDLDRAGLRVDADGSGVVNATVTYTDAVPAAQGTVTLRATAPAGWRVVIEPATTFPMNAGGRQTVTLTFDAPSTAHGAALGDALLTASVTASPGRPPGTATASVALERVDPIVVPPPDRTPVIVTSIGGVLLLGAFVVRGVRRRRQRAAAARAAWFDRETGITLARAAEPAPFGDRRELGVRLAVKNVSARARVAVVEVKDAPTGWLAAVNVPRRELRPGEETTVTLTLRPPPGAPLGAPARVTVAARPEEAEERDERVTLDLSAADPRGAGAGTAPRLLQREGPVPKTLRR